MAFSPVIQNTQSGSEQARAILPTDSAIASGAIQSGHLADNTVVSGSIASGQIGPNHLGSGSVLSGAIASGQLGLGHYQDNSVRSGAVGSGQIASGHLASGLIANLGGGSVGSGTITTDKLGSGLETIASGVMIQCMTTEPISGCKAVNSFFASTSGYMNVRIAYPTIGLNRLPAIGIVIDNVASGTLANVYIKGNIFPSGQLAGTAGQPVYVGLSGQLAANPNNTISGNQVLGYQTSHSGMLVDCSPVTTSTAWISRNEGGQSPFLSGTIQRNDLSSGLIASGHIAAGAVNSGNVSSGSISNSHISSGAITSGQVGDSAIEGWFAGGVNNIASGTIGLFNLGSGAVIAGQNGSGAVVSGNIASGQIGTKHLSSGTVVDVSKQITMTRLADEMISGGRFVCFSQGGTSGVSIAKAGDPTKMPSVGWVAENTLSGAAANIVVYGDVEFVNLNEANGLGVIIGMSGDPNSLAGLSTMSGAIIQQVGIFGKTDATFRMMMGTLPIVSGLLMYHHLASGCITSGHLAEFSVGGQNILGTNSHVMSGSIGSQDLGNLTVVSGKIQVNAVNSGNISSGVIGINHLSSGLAVPVLAEWYICAETISGLKAVCFASGGGDSVVRADRQSGLRLPAIGVTISGAVSGTACLVVILGRITGGAASGAVASGFHGRPLYVGSGGLLVNASGYMGGTSSGAPTLSGSMVQRVGIAISGGIFVNPDVTITSGLQSGLLMFQ